MFQFSIQFFQILEIIFLLFPLSKFEVYNDIITEYQSCYLISAANSSRTFAALEPISLALASYYGAGRNFIFIMDIVFLSLTPLICIQCIEIAHIIDIQLRDEALPRSFGSPYVSLK